MIASATAWLRRVNRIIVPLALSLRLVVFFGDVSLVAAAPSGSPEQAAQSQAYQPGDFLTLTNEARAENGVAPLVLNSQLDAAALAKADDMVEKGYWDHFRPSDHKAPWTFIDESGYHYKVAGENLAKGYRTPAGITRAWLASPAHRANLLSPKYAEVGFACVKADIDGQTVLLTVEMFGSR